jgi:probable rRNA maturation factor
MTLTVDISVASTASNLPSATDMEHWISAALDGRSSDTEISLRIVDEAEITALNSDYRNKQGPTNVLSFPADLPDEVATPLLGDIVICAPVVEREAGEQNKTLAAHWAHLLVHGTLHLLGYDHEHEQEAAEMEARETNILTGLDFPAPYQ